jgi:hypothetical protein
VEGSNGRGQSYTTQSVAWSTPESGARGAEGSQASSASSAPYIKSISTAEPTPLGCVEVERTKCVDETSWHQKNVECSCRTATASVVVFKLQAHRNALAARGLLHRAGGIVVTDRARAYSWRKPESERAEGRLKLVGNPLRCASVAENRARRRHCSVSCLVHMQPKNLAHQSVRIGADQ